MPTSQPRKIVPSIVVKPWLMFGITMVAIAGYRFVAADHAHAQDQEDRTIWRR